VAGGTPTSQPLPGPSGNPSGGCGEGWLLGGRWPWDAAGGFRTGGLDVSSGVMSTRRGATDGWMDGRMDGRMDGLPPAPTGHNPPLSFHLCAEVGDGRAGERLLHRAQPQGHALRPTAASERKVLGPVFHSQPLRGLGPAELGVSGALGDQAKQINGHRCHSSADGLVWGRACQMKRCWKVCGAPAAR